MKTLTKLLLLSTFAVILGVMSGPNAIAQAPESSFLRTSEPLEVGGTLLQPGVYVIKLLRDHSNRDIVQVTNEDGTKVIATLLSIPHPLKPATKEQENTEFVMYPPIEGTPRALRTWYAPHSASQGGHDIVYPQPRALQLAAVVKEPVVAFKEEVAEVKPEVLKTVDLVVVTPAKEVIAYIEPTPAPKPVAIAEVHEMPHTAGQVPLFAALGLLLLSVAVVFRAFRAV